MPEILKNLRLGVKEEVEEIKWGKFNGLEEFLKFYQGKYCKNLVSKVILDFEFKKKYGFSLINKKKVQKDFFLEEFDSLFIIQNDSRNLTPEELKSISGQKAENIQLNDEEDSKSIDEPEEEKKFDFPAHVLKFREFDFLNRFYFLLGIDKPSFLLLPRIDRIRLLDNKYSEMIDRLKKYINVVNKERHYKQEREQLGFLMCENYLTSEEDQYMFNELQELKFFILALKSIHFTINVKAAIYDHCYVYFPTKTFKTIPKRNLLG